MSKSKVVAAYLDLMREFDKLPPEAKPADGMPELPIWRARSFWYGLFAIALLVGSILGFDVMGWFEERGLGGTVPALIENIELILMGLSAVLAYRERLKPNYKLVWKGLKSIAVDDKSAVTMIQCINEDNHKAV